jgi:simple sugar transport system ATP-binding protein
MIHALMGANGAGKSTLMKVIAGSNPDYTGEVLYNGNPVELRSPAAAKKLGIQIVYQEVDMALVPNLTVAENVMFNDTVMNMKGKLFMNYTKLRADAKEVLDQLHVSIDVNRICSTLSLAEKQLVLIARAIQNECNFLILDEPTAPLSDAETDELFRVVQHLCDTRNMAVIFITHRIHEVLRICDSYTVMRNGEVVDRSPITSETTSKEIVDKMLGRSFEENFPKEVCEIGEKSFVIENLTEKDDKVKDINMYVRKGEIVGLAGLVGGGKTELCKTIFGAYKKKSGTITLNGKELKIKKPTDAVKNRIALVPEERRKEGVLVAETCIFNLAAASLDQFCNFGFVDTVKTAKNAQHYVDDLGVKTPSIKQKVALLSGGNQQKVVVGKWLAADCDVYIFDEPTKGVDVGAKMEIFRLINQIAKEGNCVIYATCENSELLSITDRMYVMFDGKIMAELETAKTSEKEIMHYATGATEAYVEE